MPAPSRKLAVGRSLLLLVALAALAAAGCGRRAGSINGTVRYKGELLPIGDIAFLSQEGDQQVRHADIIEGRYSIPNMPIGRCKVVVTTWQPSTRKKSRLSAGGAAPAEVPEAPAAVQAILIPAHYGNPDQSGLTYEVKGGSQTKDFDLGP